MRRLQRAGFRAARKRIGKMPRERLRKHLRGPLRRRIVLRVVFTAMPRAVRRKALARENLVVEFRLTGARDGRPDVRQLVIEDGAASVFRASRARPISRSRSTRPTSYAWRPGTPPRPRST